MAWRLALHIARREAWRNKGRSALVAAMIALPVAGTAPTADDQIAVTPALAAETHKGVGDTLQVHNEGAGPAADTSAKTLRISGIYDSVNYVDDNTVFARHGVFTIANQPLDY